MRSLNSNLLRFENCLFWRISRSFSSFLQFPSLNGYFLKAELCSHYYPHIQVFIASQRIDVGGKSGTRQQRWKFQRSLMFAFAWAFCIIFVLAIIWYCPKKLSFCAFWKTLQNSSCWWPKWLEYVQKEVPRGSDFLLANLFSLRTRGFLEFMIKISILGDFLFSLVCQEK